MHFLAFRSNSVAVLQYGDAADGEKGRLEMQSDKQWNSGQSVTTSTTIILRIGGQHSLFTKRSLACRQIEQKEEEEEEHLL